MQSIIRLFISLIVLGLLSSVQAMVEPGKPAPGFRLQSVDGETVTIDQFKGRWVVLEWTNPDCPFVLKHYGSSNMQSLQQYAAAQKVVWLQINSTHAGHSEYRSPLAMKAWNAEQKAVPSFALLDPQGIAGRAYGARTTPQVVLINPIGVLVYHGAIDSIRSANPADIPKAVPLLRKAIEEGLAGKAIGTPTSVPYGCSVKYA